MHFLFFFAVFPAFPFSDKPFSAERMIRHITYRGGSSLASNGYFTSAFLSSDIFTTFFSELEQSRDIFQVFSVLITILLQRTVSVIQICYLDKYHPSAIGMLL